MDGSGYFDDQYEFDSCRREVEDFVSDAEDYAACLEDARAEAIREANDVVEKFNCRAQGRSFC